MSKFRAILGPVSKRDLKPLGVVIIAAQQTEIQFFALYLINRLNIRQKKFIFVEKIGQQGLPFVHCGSIKGHELEVLLAHALFKGVSSLDLAARKGGFFLLGFQGGLFIPPTGVRPSAGLGFPFLPDPKSA